ncbi:flagellar hook-basal body protein [Candidatus Epulonipiscium viviparus]|uniref:flagellar hook-basal body protein n=1 Tax=Candidatus Epulonipiscium viviparus TaxID=420336 RepID=UPI000497818F|nr:flagellar hook-basal body protein [Candidatus Epulopiscium viviparus]
MMRSLWTAATGMTSQQTHVDTISNNIANVNTVGFKQESVNFKTLLYQNMLPTQQEETTNPMLLQMGHGVRVGSISKNFGTGNLIQTNAPTDLAIDGTGFFAVQADNQVSYTRDGSFKVTTTSDGVIALVTSDGHYVLSTDSEPITFDENVLSSQITINSYGGVGYKDSETGEDINIADIMVVQFANAAGLEATGDNLFVETAGSGVPLMESEEPTLTKSLLRAGYLEGSNVNIATEMVNLIVAQRAYELNSKAISTADTMLGQAVQLKKS